MNEHVATLVCPNCGASTSNRKKCEFCGSVLVRFADKNVEDLEEKFGKRAKIIPGLDIAIEENLRLQETIDESSMVITSVFPVVPQNIRDKNDRFWYSKTVLGSNAYQIISSKDTFWGCSLAPEQQEELGVSIRIPFAINSPLPPNKQIADQDENMDCFNNIIDDEQLFTAAKYKEGVVYGLSLGQDSKSAAKIATWYFNVIEESMMGVVEDRSIFSFDVKTELIEKSSAKYDDLGIIVRGAKPKEPKDSILGNASQGESSEKKSFWKKLFG